jgi:hypothetical protein
LGLGGEHSQPSGSQRRLEHARIEVVAAEHIAIVVERIAIVGLEHIVVRIELVVGRNEGLVRLQRIAVAEGVEVPET